MGILRAIFSNNLPQKYGKKIGDTILLSVESLCSSQPRISNNGKCTVNRIHDETTNRFINMQK